MEKVEYHLSTVRTSDSKTHVQFFTYTSVLIVSGPVEYDPEYQLIVESNNMIVEIDNEICR